MSASVTSADPRSKDPDLPALCKVGDLIAPERRKSWRPWRGKKPRCSTWS